MDKANKTIEVTLFVGYNMTNEMSYHKYLIGLEQSQFTPIETEVAQPMK